MKIPKHVFKTIRPVQSTAFKLCWQLFVFCFCFFIFYFFSALMLYTFNSHKPKLMVVQCPRCVAQSLKCIAQYPRCVAQSLKCIAQYPRCVAQCPRCVTLCNVFGMLHNFFGVLRNVLDDRSLWQRCTGPPWVSLFANFMGTSYILYLYLCTTIIYCLKQFITCRLISTLSSQSNWCQEGPVSWLN